MHAHKKMRLSTPEEETNEGLCGDDSVVSIHNRVYFHSSVSRKSIVKMIEKLNDAISYARTNGDANVILFIHSEGGDAFAGLSGMNHIETCGFPVTTVADGFVASAATLLLLGGRTRFGMPQSTILIHQLSTEFWGKYVYLKDEVANAKQLMKVLTDVYVKKTTMAREHVQELMTKELYMSSKKALHNGVFQKYYSVTTDADVSSAS